MAEEGGADCVFNPLVNSSSLESYILISSIIVRFILLDQLEAGEVAHLLMLNLLSQHFSVDSYIFPFIIILNYFFTGLGGGGGVAVFVVFPSCTLLGLLVPVSLGGAISNLSIRIIRLLFLYNSFRWRWRRCSLRCYAICVDTHMWDFGLLGRRYRC